MVEPLTHRAAAAAQPGELPVGGVEGEPHREPQPHHQAHGPGGLGDAATTTAAKLNVALIAVT